MDVVYRRGRVSAAEVRGELPEAPSDSAVRALLRILEDKGHLRRERSGARFVYVPASSRDVEARSALRRVLRTFFDDSAEKAVVALLDVSDAHLPQDELDRLVRLIEQARSEGR
jgi:BlaI family transcriptional regulator, penicillinase repressor